MKVVRVVLSVGLLCAAAGSVTGCGPGPGAGGTGGAGSGGAPGSGGATGTGGRAATGGAPASGGAGSGGAPASGGASMTGGAPGSGGATGTGGRSGGSGGSTGGAGGSGGTPNGTGGGGPVTPHGSAAKFICQPGATYGSPLTGMGAVQQFMPPQGDYFAFIEGPVWIGSAGTGTVFFSDNASSPDERIFKVVPPSMTVSLFMGTSGSNGLAVDNSDRIVVADQRNRRITRVDAATGMMVGVVASTGSAKPNDVLVRSDDNIYFTDPDTGFYRISPTGTVSAAMNVMQGSRPNGIELSLDENTLYVGDVGNKSITKFTLAADGTVMMATAALFATTMNTTADGMCTDCAGNVYASTQGGVEIYSPAGTYIGTVLPGEASNCTFGGPARKTLYVTSRMVLKAIDLGVPGLPD